MLLPVRACSGPWRLAAPEPRSWTLGGWLRVPVPRALVQPGRRHQPEISHIPFRSQSVIGADIVAISQQKEAPVSFLAL